MAGASTGRLFSNRMSEGMLIATQLSCLSHQIVSVPLDTSRSDTPLPAPVSDSDPPPEHSLHSSIFHSPQAGTILLRVIHAGLILELISISKNVQPIRFVFPSPVLTRPGIFEWEQDELHLLAVTASGSLYRLVLPAHGQLWHDPVLKNWTREYLIKSPLSGLVHVQGPHSVVVGTQTGTLLRLDTVILGDETRDDHWTEQTFTSGSFLNSLVTYLPLQTLGENASHIISMASHPQPTDIDTIWTLSRDRHLRLWTAKSGCIASTAMAPHSKSFALTGTPAPHSLLGSEPQNLLQVIPTDLGPQILVFTPSPTYSHTGGYFQMIDASNNNLKLLNTIDCSKLSAGRYLRDFGVIGDKLYVLWDSEGQSIVEQTPLRSNQPHWRIATYNADLYDLTPTYLEELLLSPGSMASIFLRAIARPGIFSANTLRTAVNNYTDACLSLPGVQPACLTASYRTTLEQIAAVVGCTVQLLRDPTTGVLQHVKYATALKRDWEGFVARCREVERGARCPIKLSAISGQGIFVVERERLGQLVEEDLPLKMYRSLNSGQSPQSHFAILEVAWMLRSKLPSTTLLILESRVMAVLHQEIQYSFVDIIEDEATRCDFFSHLDPAFGSWIGGRLASIPDLDRATRTILDLITELDGTVKQEEEEVELLLPQKITDIDTAMITAYISTAIHVRYEMALSLASLLFYLSRRLSDWDTSLLTEVFVVVRGLAILRHVSRQGFDPEKASSRETTAEDMIARMSSMQVSSLEPSFTPTYSLIHRLLTQTTESHMLPAAAHNFLDSTGLLASISPAHATKYEVIFCERLRIIGCYAVAQDVLGWLPRTPGICYTTARLYLDTDRSDNAAYLFGKLAGSFGENVGLTEEDTEALASVLPQAQMFANDFEFYLHVASLFKSASLVSQDVAFTQMALSVSISDPAHSDLWSTVIQGYASLGRYDDTYTSLIACPYEKLKRESVMELVYRMCEDNEINKLISFNFAGFADEVEKALAFKSRNSDPRDKPYYSQILYSWYISRSDYRSAALTMYLRSRKIQELSQDISDTVGFAEQQRDACMIAINALSLLSRSSAWFSIPWVADTGREPRKRRKLSRHIPEERYAPGKQDSEVVELSDIQCEYALLSARLHLHRINQHSQMSLTDLSLPAESVVLKLAQANQFNTAIATACSLNVNMTDLFAHLTTQCLRLSRNPSLVLQSDRSDWLLTDEASSWSGTPVERGWRYLRVALERHDNVDIDNAYTKVSLETILTYDRETPRPQWLIQSLEKHHPEYLIRISLKYDILESALEHALTLVRKADSSLDKGSSLGASAMWLPYTLLEQALAASNDQTTTSPRTRELHKQLQSALAVRVKRLQKILPAARAL